jgi:hypothetical protein
LLIFIYLLCIFRALFLRDDMEIESAVTIEGQGLYLFPESEMGSIDVGVHVVDEK